MFSPQRAGLFTLTRGGGSFERLELKLLLRNGLLAMALVAGSALAQWLMRDVAGLTPFATFYPAVLLAALLGGWWPGLAATLLSLAIPHLIGIAHGHASDGASPVGFLNDALFLTNSVAIVALGAFARELLRERRLQAQRMDQLLVEQNHRIKNNLAQVSVLLRMQAKAAGEPQVRHALEEAMARVQSFAELHQQLYSQGTPRSVDAQSYLGRLCQVLEATLDTGRIRLECRVQPVELDVDQAMALGMALTELVTNSAKYGARPGELGVISIAFEEANGEVSLIVSDTGPGLPEEKRPGFGMRVLTALAEQMGGKVSFGGTQQGARIELRAPLANAQEAA